MTKIEWATQVWNPISGCSPVSAGCDACYARKMAHRLQAMGQEKYRDGFAVRCHPDTLEQPAKWRKPRRIFCCSMSDLFHVDVPDEFIHQVFTVMHAHPRHLFMVLTKRAERLARMGTFGDAIPLPPHIWLGVSVESQRHVSRIRQLQSIGNATRFISFEPLLGPIEDVDLSGISMAIIGGESGPGARPMRLEWAREIKRQCRVQGTSVFFKQCGTAWAKANGAKHPKGGDMEEFPADLRVREYPK